MQETLCNYPKVYLSIIGSHWEKESMETEMTVSARPREATYPAEKKRADTDLEFFSWFSVVFLTCFSAELHLV